MGQFAVKQKEWRPFWNKVYVFEKISIMALSYAQFELGMPLFLFLFFFLRFCFSRFDSAILSTPLCNS